MRTRYNIKSNNFLTLFKDILAYFSSKNLQFMIHFQRPLERSDSSLESTAQDRKVAVELNIVEVLRSDVETSDNAIELRSIEINPDKTNVRYYYIIVII